MPLSLLLCGVCLLLALRAIQVRQPGISTRTWPGLLWPALLCGLIAASIGVDHAARGLRLVPNSEASALLRYAEPRLESVLADPGGDLLVVVNGASATARGVDTQLLEAGLKRGTGLYVRVIQLSLPGANHFERQAIARSLMSQLSPAARSRARGIPMLVLWEVHRGYDIDLLAQFRENRDSARTYGYLDLLNYSAALHGLAFSMSDNPRKALDKLLVALDLMRHALVHALNVGASKWQVSSRHIVPLPGFDPKIGNMGGFRVVALETTLARSRRIRGELPAGDVDALLVPRYLQTFAPNHPGIVFFAPPSMHADQVAYISAFCRSHDAPCIGSDDERLMHRLSDKRYWWDGSHLSNPGARLYTRWLAERLAYAINQGDL